MHLIIDGQRIRVKFITFAGGEEHAQLCMEDVEALKARIPYAIEEGKKFSSSVMVAHGYIKSSKELMRFMNMVSAGYGVCRPEEVVFNLPYLSYARQDRICSPGQAFGLQMVVDMLASLGPNEVVVDDIHSNVAKSLFTKHNIVFNERTQDFIFDRYHLAPANSSKFAGDWVIVAPDEGATSKSQVIADRCNVKMFQGWKVRDPSTGDITGTAVDCGDFRGKDVWLVDDCADGGRTFIELAKVIRQRNAGKLGLFVTHAIFSKGKDILYEHFNYLGCKYDWTKHEIIDEF